jgi:hypothetical protein
MKDLSLALVSMSNEQVASGKYDKPTKLAKCNISRDQDLSRHEFA